MTASFTKSAGACLLCPSLSADIGQIIGDVGFGVLPDVERLDHLLL